MLEKENELDYLLNYLWYIQLHKFEGRLELRDLKYMLQLF